MSDARRWDIWHVYYMTHAEILTLGDKKRECVARNLKFDEARKMIEKLGFGYSMHPSSHAKD